MTEENYGFKIYVTFNSAYLNHKKLFKKTYRV